MGKFINRDTLEDIHSANEPEHPDPPWMYFQPGGATDQIVQSVPVKYRKLIGDVLMEMSPPEKAAVDAAALEAARNAAIEAEIDNLEAVARAMFKLLMNDRNMLAERLSSLLDAIDAASNLATLKTSAAAIDNPPQYTLQQLRTALRNELGS